MSTTQSDGPAVATPGEAPPAAPQSRAEVTRQSLLDAAQEVFGEHGYAAAAIAEVVRRAGASVGSLYHHFSGKVDLYLALWEDFRLGQSTAATRAVATLKSDGETDPVSLFLAGTRAYLDNCWQRRDVAKLFLTGDGPPGFEVLRRQNTREWLRHNAVLLRAEQRPADRVLIVVLTTTIAEVGRELASCKDATEAAELTDAALKLIRTLFTYQS